MIENFDEVGRALLLRMQREVLAEPEHGPLRELLDELLTFVAPEWRTPDLSQPATPALVIKLKMPQLSLRFLTMVTVFQAPQSVLLDEIRIETWFPADDATRSFFR